MSTTGLDVDDAVLDAVRSVHPRIHPSEGVLPDPVVLWEVARGGRSGLTVRERASAVTALARHPDGGNHPETYRQLATESEEPPEVQASAVAGLRFLSPERAEPVAIDLLDAGEDAVASNAVGTLTVVGRERAFEALDERFDIDVSEGTLGDPSTFEDVTVCRVAFTRAVAGHRARLEKTPPFGVTGVDRDRLDAVALEGSMAEFSETVRDRTDGPLFGVEPRADAVEIGASVDSIPPMTLVLDRNVTADPSRLAAAPSLPGVVLARAEETDGYEPDLLVFGDPVEEGQGVNVTVTRVDGKAVYAGRGVPDGDSLEISLSDTGLVGTAPTRLRLRLGPDDVTLLNGAVDPAGAVTRAPEPWNHG